MSRYTRGLLAVILAVVLVLPAAAFAMLPEANARSSTGMDGPTMTEKIVDYDTSNHWKFWAGGYDGKEETTQNVGRIWTDKTVKKTGEGETSDFLTTLSTISSTSDTTISGKPLDIVMVLDASGSMDDPMGKSDNTKRIKALKTAANGFIDTIAEQNAKISDESKQHQVAIVKFAGKKSDNVGNDTYYEQRNRYNYSQTMKKLTPCEGEGAESLKKTVNSISPAGATQADYGLQLAEGISSNRADAQKIVVFFTDGSPTSSNGFEHEVAKDAINTAKTIKNGGATIYTIGIFSGAKPSDNPTNDDTSNANKFMHAVSSNYPNASSSVSYGFFGAVDWSVNFGDSVADASYYKSATSAAELEKIFEEISGSIIQAGYPTETHDGYGEQKPGYITFTDRLGDFMQVDTFTSVVYNGTTFDKKTMKTEGNVDTYTFEGAAANLVITVQHAEEGKPQTGDIVTVKIPASLIPLRHFKITDGVLTVDNTEPIQVNYTSSVKKDALDNLFTPEKVTGLKDYIERNTTTTENRSKIVSFYANKWNAGALGDTIANFEPASTNRYYYFQKNTPIYMDEDCTTPAKGSLDSNRIYYYKDEFEVKGAGDKAESRTAVIKFTGGHAASFEGAIVSDDKSGNLSFSKGTARLAFIDELHTTKERVGGNPTGTAADVLNPKWNNMSAKSNATEVDVHLGNNGKISYKYDMTPTTVDTKADFGLTKVLEGRAWTKEDAFEFELTSENNAPMPESATEPVTVSVTNDDPNERKAAIDFGTIEYKEPGTYVYKVSEKNAGTTVDGVAYSKNVAEITVTVTPNKKGELSADVKVTSGKTEFKNVYTAEHVESSVTDQIDVAKSLSGRDLAAGEFRFELVEGNDVVATGTNDAEGNITMNAIEYTAAGEHTYTLREVNGGTASNGISYDGKTYTIETTITDNGKGELVAKHELKGDNEAKFNNSYKPNPDEFSVTDQIAVTKALTGRDLKEGEFNFELVEGEGEDAKVVATGTNAADGKITMGTVKYDKPGKHTYTLREVNGGTTSKGITYGDAEYTIETTITDKGDGTLEAKHVLKGGGKAEFTNSYKPGSKDSSVTGQVKATKSLDGRDLKAGEFHFELVEGNNVVATGTNNADGKIVMDPVTYTAAGEHTYTLRETKAGATENGITYSTAEYTIVTKVTDNGDGTLSVEHKLQSAEPAEFKNSYNLTPKDSSVTDKVKATKSLDGRDLKAGEFRFELVEGNDVVATGTNDAEGNITMNAIEYTAAGEHTYTLREVNGGTASNGISYDGKTYTIETTITDNGKGELVAKHELKGDNEAKFNNSYKPNPDEFSVTDQIAVTKALTGRDLKEGEFNFELVEGEGEDAKVVATGTNAADGKITMGTVKYDKPGKHTYTLREVNGGTTSKGITYGDAEYTIETTITDKGDGTLEAKHVLKGGGKAEFTNSYKPGSKDSSVTDQIVANKKLSGREPGLAAGEFRFELVEGNNVVAIGTNNADGKIVMDPVTYTAAGEHTYTLRETKAGATENGITYSTAEYTIVTIVKDNGDGTLSVEHKLQNVEKAIFENAYNLTPKSFSVTDKITATKYLTGRDLKAGEFSFELVEGNEVVATGTNAADGKITMDPIEYTEAGKHTYTLREVPGDAGNGITYDGKTYTIETTITDNGDGTLSAAHELKGADEAKFNNGYKPNPDEFSVTDQIKATKSLTGRDLKEGEFNFELVEGDEVVATGTNAADGKITMSAVKYTEAGKHTYTLREAKGGTTSKGITYSDAEYTIVTTITDKGDGTLEAKHVLKGDATAATFENTYRVTPIDADLDFDLSKAIDGREWTDADEFSFTITAPEGTPLPNPATVTVSNHDAKDGIAAIKFGKIHYTAAGTYKYEIRESAGNAAGMTYDTNVATAEVTVTENGDGTLIANVTKKANGRFTNTYRTELNYTAAGGLKLSKSLYGRPMTEGQFTFTVTPADEASANALGLHEGANVYKSPATAEATVGLIDILAGHEVKFTQADAGKTFTYTVAEKNDHQPGYTYDDAVRTVTIAIADDGAGTLTATTTVSGGSEGTHTMVHKSGENKVESALVPFRNSYSATTDTTGGAQVVATKTLTGRPMTDGEFCFGIAYAGETEAINGTTTWNLNGQVSFGTLHYTTKMLADLVNAGRAIRTDADAKLAWTINYTAFEYTSPLAAKGITAATPSFSFKVIVVDNGDGTLTAKPDYGGADPVFKNVYGTDAVNVALTGTKKLQAAKGLTPADIAGKFTFTVTADEAGAPMPECTIATNDAAGKVDFGNIHFTLDDLNRALGVTTDASDDASSDAEANADEVEVDADAADTDESEPAAPTAPRSHTFTYTVTESGSALGVTNDANVTRKVSYTVTDDAAGHLKVVREGGDGADFTFTNTYGVTPIDSYVTDQVKTVKRLTGRDLAVGEFTFELLEDGVVVASGTNDANGTVTLSPIRYEAPGTHAYTLREACPNALGLYKGVTYDGATYTVVTTVSDNGDGTLTATHKLEGTTESAGFTNKYHAMPTQVSIGAIKVLEGRELKKDEFSFKLVGEDIESTVTNDADGKINFDKFEYDEPGTYVYTISEVKGDEAGMTYDKSVFTATVNVVDDGEGNLKASVAYTKGDKSVEGIVFNNTYKKPETPAPDPGTSKTVTNIVKTVKGFLPTTGDQQAAALLMAFVIAMSGVGALIWGIRKR